MDNIKMKSLLYYSLFFIAVLLVNHLYAEYTAPKSNKLIGDFSSLGVTESTPIVAYTASWCDACKSLKSYLDQKEVSYINIDVELDKTAKSNLKQYGLTGIPVVIIEDTLFEGYNPTLLQNRLDVLFMAHNN